MDGKYECLLAGTSSCNGNFNIQKIAERKGLLCRKKSSFNKGVRKKGRASCWLHSDAFPSSAGEAALQSSSITTL
jgi:hypothetical protein